MVLLNKKGIYFSIDAILAVVLLIAAVLLVAPITSDNRSPSRLPGDVISSLSSLKVGDIAGLDPIYITDPENSVLEQIGFFYATGDRDKAINLTDLMFADLESNENIGIWFGNELIASKNRTPYKDAEDIETSRALISGIVNGSSATGFSARAFLNGVNPTKFFYFGGFIGEGNITANMSYDGAVSSVSIELAINEDFELYVNGNYSGIYDGSGLDEFVPIKHILNRSTLDLFKSGENIIEFKGLDLHIAGGFIKISYDSSESFSITNRYQFPGIEGVINLFDGFYIPGTINSMEISLHMNSSVLDTFLHIGNTTVYLNTTNDEETISLTNAQLLSYFGSYDHLSQKTVPVRLGILDLINRSGKADVILITDLSKSMEGRLDDDTITGVFRECGDPLLFDPSTARVSLAQCLDKTFIDIVMSVPGNRIGFVGYFGDTLSGGGPRKGKVNRTDFFLNDSVAAKAIVDEYDDVLGYDSDSYDTPIGGTCICCSLNSAYHILDSISEPENRTQFVLVMSDGIPTHRCTTTGAWPASWQGLQTGYPGTDAANPITSGGCSNEQEATNQCDILDPIDNKCGLAMLNANWSSCRLHNDPTGMVDAKVFSIGFGDVVECGAANETMRSIADCGGGSFFSSNDPDQLQLIYTTIAEEILELSFVALYTRLYPDSYIDFNISLDTVPFGIVITKEVQFSNTTTGSYDIPDQASTMKLLSRSSCWSKLKTATWTASFGSYLCVSGGGRV